MTTFDYTSAYGYAMVAVAAALGVIELIRIYRNHHEGK